MKPSNVLYKWVIAGVLVLGIVSFATTSSNHTSSNPTIQSASVDTSLQPTLQPSTPSPKPPPVIFTTYLAYGSSGTAVANLQQFLADEGLYSGSDSGYFDTATQEAVMAFQRQENITPIDGIFEGVAQAHANSILATHPDWVTYLSNGSSYSNVNGSQVQAPAYSTNGVPAGATAICGDGTYSFSMHRSGTCSHHGGVSQWLQ